MLRRLCSRQPHKPCAVARRAQSEDQRSTSQKRQAIFYPIERSRRPPCVEGVHVAGTSFDRSTTHLTEETNPPATEDEAPRATAEPPAVESTPVADEAPETPTANATADPDATQAAAQTNATAVAVEEPPAAETDVAAAEPPATAATEEPTPMANEAATGEPAAAAAPIEAAASGNGSAEPMTMAELLDQPDVEVKSLKHGDVVEGTVVRIDPDEILVDFGGKSEGVVSNRELIGRRGGRDGDDSRPEIKVGDEVLVYVLQPESPEGHAVLSLRRAGLERKWRAMQERFESGEIVEARV